MTIQYVTGDILHSKMHAIVIPVNTMGIPGAGLARQWAAAYPLAASTYKAVCHNTEFGVAFSVGTVLLVQSGSHVFLCFPTKIMPRKRSELLWIQRGLSDLARLVPHKHIRSLAIPALGCGLGGLAWRNVKPLIERYLGGLEIPVHIYPPR